MIAPEGQEFTLSSGAKSKFYIDLRKLTLDAAGSGLVARLLAVSCADLNYDAVGGPTLGADPIVGAVLMWADVRHLSLRGFLVRKEAKGHGTQQQIEGGSPAGCKVLVVEDVVTSGNSVNLALTALEQAGAQVVGVVSVLDRSPAPTTQWRCNERSYPYRPMVHLADLDLPQ